MNNIFIFLVELIGLESLQTLVIRFMMNIFFNLILILGIYNRDNRNTEYLFNFIIFNILIFFVSSFLSRVQMETGFAFGLFAIFSILRYRTEPIPIKEMTFMFISIIMATINSTVTIALNYPEILFANLTIILATWIMERKWLNNRKPSKSILFDRIELVHEERRPELIAELERRTGLKITEVKIQKINFLNDTVRIKAYLE